jgi:hypothetical protein
MSDGYIDVVVGMQVSTLVVYAHVQHWASNLSPAVFGIAEGKLALHVDDSTDGAGAIPGAAVRPFSLNLDAGLDVDQFVDRAYAETNSFFVSILEQLP